MQLRPLHEAIRTVWTIKLGLGLALPGLGVLAYDVLHLFDADRLLPTGLLRPCSTESGRRAGGGAWVRRVRGYVPHVAAQ